MSALFHEQMSYAQRAAIRLKSTFAGGGPMLLDRLIEIYDSDLDIDASLAHYVFPMLAALPQESFAPYTLADLAPRFTWILVLLQKRPQFLVMNWLTRIILR